MPASETVLVTGVTGFVGADYRLWARDPEEIVRNNRTGTANVLEAALGAGTGRIVYTSSVATLAPARSRTQPSTEEDALAPAQAVGAYKRSKVVAERLVEQLIAERGLPAVIVNPSTPIGPRDVKPTPTGRIIVEAATGKMPAFVETGLNFVHVDDVAHGHLLAYEKGAIGRRYILGGHDVTLGDFIAEVARQAGRKPPTLKLPIAPLFPIAWIAEAFAMLSGREPFLTADSLRMSSHYMYYSPARAQAELGYGTRPWQQAVTDALDWFGAHEMLA
jgi:dihydroflavonol-4-reductase